MIRRLGDGDLPRVVDLPVLAQLDVAPLPSLTATDLHPRAGGGGAEATLTSVSPAAGDEAEAAEGAEADDDESSDGNSDADGDPVAVQLCKGHPYQRSTSKTREWWRRRTKLSPFATRSLAGTGLLCPVANS